LRRTIALRAGCVHIAFAMAKKGQQKAKNGKPVPAKHLKVFPQDSTRARNDQT
jgi:hypothetical protein